ncbi:MAG: RNA polymerase sigma factor [Bacteroidota bacterium]
MRSISESDLPAILLGCSRNKRSSQNALYRLYYSYGMSVAIRYVGTESEALSIVNDAFLKVFDNIKKYNPNQPFKPWFRRILVNTAINAVKKKQKYKMEVNIDEAKKVAASEKILSQISYKELMGMLQSLSLAYRTVFNLYVIDGFKHSEIAEMLGITESTSKSNLTRARVKLKAIIEEKLKQPYV